MIGNNINDYQLFLSNYFLDLFHCQFFLDDINYLIIIGEATETTYTKAEEQTDPAYTDYDNQVTIDEEK